MKPRRYARHYHCRLDSYRTRACKRVPQQHIFSRSGGESERRRQGLTQGCGICLRSIASFMKRHAACVYHQSCHVLQYKKLDLIFYALFLEPRNIIFILKTLCNGFFDDLLTVGYREQLAFYRMTLYGESIVFSYPLLPCNTLCTVEKLAEARQNTSSEYVKKQLAEVELNANVDTKYTAEDWEGFKELVSASNIQDKEVILRVLSMYADPEEREKQIKNISAAYTELVDEILPELRRARLIVNYAVIGRTDAEIAQQYAADASKLSVEEMLYLAKIQPENAKAIYTNTAKYYPNDYRAYNNLAIIALNAGNLDEAKGFLNRAASIAPNAAEVNANIASVALAEGNTAAAESYIGRAANAENYKELVATLQAQKGNYAAAAASAKGVNTNAAALTQILNKDYTSALATLNAVAKPTATTDYLKAVCGARTNNVDAAVSSLKAAFAKDSSLKAKAAKDLEFVKIAESAAFKALF